jgi:hypothetical protein
MQKINRPVILFILLILAGIPAGFGQVQISSPYSRYGLGDLQIPQLDRGLSMGGIGYAFRDSLTINIKNPASYTRFDSASFLCDVGIVTQYSQLQSNTMVQKFNNMTTLGYITFGFPITRWWGSSIGLVPYSQKGYKIQVRDTIDGAGAVLQKYQGTGSLNRFYFGNGFRLHRDLSLGFNVSFLFGTLNNISSIYFSDLTYVFNTRITNSTIINDFHFEAGLQYHHTFKNNWFVNGGLVYQIPYDMTGRKNYLVERFVSSTSAETTRDTIDYIHNNRGKIHYPGGIGGGIMFGVNQYWMLGIDAAWQNWDNYTNFGVKDSLKSNLNLNIGFEIIPKHTSVSNYFRKIRYHLGARYQDTYLNLHTQAISEYAVSAGMSFPFKRTMNSSGSAINVAVEFGQRGTTKNNLIKDTFIRGILGISIKENWFGRRRLD